MMLDGVEKAFEELVLLGTAPSYIGVLIFAQCPVMSAE
jgi:hypothetical protein